ncbi:MAG: hypothetical protein AVDCRST_MAG07-3371, partial [uncultured Frankineae bacterium]
MSPVRQEEIWDEEAARRYDTPGTGIELSAPMV